MLYVLLNSHVTTKEKNKITFSPWADTQKFGESGSGSDGVGWVPSHLLLGGMGGEGLGRLSGKRMEQRSKTKSKIPTPSEMQPFHLKAFTF